MNQLKDRLWSLLRRSSTALLRWSSSRKDDRLSEIRALLNEVHVLSQAGKDGEALDRLHKCLSIINTVEIDLAAAGEGSETTILNMKSGLRETDRAQEWAVARYRIVHQAIETAIRAKSGRDGLDLMALLKGRRLYMQTEYLQTKRQFGDLFDYSLSLMHLDAHGVYTPETCSGLRLCVVEFFHNQGKGIWCVIGRADETGMKSQWVQLADAEAGSALEEQTMAFLVADSPKSRASVLNRLLDSMTYLFGAIIDEITAWHPQKVVLIPHRFLNLLPWHACRSRSDKRMLMEGIAVVTFANNSLQYGWCRNIAYGCWDAPPRKTVACIDVNKTVSGWAAAGAFPMLIGNRDPLVVLNPRKETLMAALKTASAFFYFGHARADFKEYGNACLETYGEQTSFADLLSDVIGSKMLLGVLSGCETGRNSNISDIRDEYYGLDGAFCARGTGTIISALWPVSDLAAFLVCYYIQRILPQSERAPAAILAQAASWLASGSWHSEKTAILESCSFEALEAHLPVASKEPVRGLVNQFHQIFSELSQDAFSHPLHWAAWRCMGFGGDPTL